MAGVIAPVFLVADAAGNAALPGWVVSAYGLDRGRWAVHLPEAGRLLLVPVAETEADLGTPVGSEPAPAP